MPESAAPLCDEPMTDIDPAKAAEEGNAANM